MFNKKLPQHNKYPFLQNNFLRMIGICTNFPQSTVYNNLLFW